MNERVHVVLGGEGGGLQDRIYRLSWEGNREVPQA